VLPIGGYAFQILPEKLEVVVEAVVIVSVYLKNQMSY
jgi:hypothetical protein